jgi:mannose-6-phosphate isomerase-like protein (cupin superfamily)
MARGIASLVLALMCVVAGSTVLAQDVTAVAANHYKVLFENQYVRVLKCTMAPGEKDPEHVHAAGVYYITGGGALTYTPEGGKTETEQAKAGDCMWSDAEGPHTSENSGKTPLSWILVEVKGAKEKAVPVTREGDKK